MNQTILHKSSKHFFCSKCGTQTSHYVRANGESVICLSCGDERSVKQIVEVVPLTHGKPEQA